MSARTIEVYECDVCRDRAIVAAALAWVRRIQDPPMLWADEADRALIEAVRANYPHAAADLPVQGEPPK